MHTYKVINMPSSKAEKNYEKDFLTLFKAAQQALLNLGAEIESANETNGEIKAIKKFQLIKKAKFIIIVNESGTVSAESAMSALMMGAIDIGRNAKFIKEFFENLDNTIKSVKTVAPKTQNVNKEIIREIKEKKSKHKIEYRETLQSDD